MKDDGTMARYPDLVEFGNAHGLRIISIADLIEYRLSREKLVKALRQTPVVMPSGKQWTAHVYEVDVDDRRQFLALTYGEIGPEPTLIRVHTGSVLGDIFGVRMGRRVYMGDAVERIEAAGSGVVLFLPGRPDPLSDLAFYLGEPVALQSSDQGEVLREYGLGAQVLADLGLRKVRIMTNRPRRVPSLEAYGLEIVDQELVPANDEKPLPSE
jgi:3,4-dihydroxy 2-butanone 4-phosphate synthase/GTP cyclohydrolase II